MIFKIDNSSIYGKLKRALCLLFSLVLLCQAAPVLRAEAKQVSLPEVELNMDILNNDVFYMATTAATLQEGANTPQAPRIDTTCRFGVSINYCNR